MSCRCDVMVIRCHGDVMSLCLRCTCCDCSSSDDWLKSLRAQAGVSVCCGCRETLGDVWFLCAWRPGVTRVRGGSSGRGWFGSPSLKAACRCLSGAFGRQQLRVGGALLRFISIYFLTWVWQWFQGCRAHFVVAWQQCKCSPLLSWCWRKRERRNNHGHNNIKTTYV